MLRNIHLSTNNGGTWLNDSNGLPKNGLVMSLAVSGSNIFAGTPGNGVFLSTNNGQNWTRTEALGGFEVSSLSISGENIFAGISGGGPYIGIYLSSNNGASWNALSNGYSVLSLDISGSNIFAGTEEGILLSTDNGTSWNDVNNEYPIYSLDISGNNIFASTIGGVFLSTNNGLDWSLLNNGLTNTHVYSLAITNGKNIFAGTGSKLGVFLSTNDGTNWNDVSNGLPDSAEIVSSLAISRDTLFAGTNVIGVWKRSLSDILGINKLNVQHSDFSIQITPNPVNQSANITYQLPQKEQITIKIYDLTGREITTLLNETKEKGNYKLNFNTENLQTGLYFLKASTNTKSTVSKFIKE